jgi:hypothetical protein
LHTSVTTCLGLVARCAPNPQSAMAEDGRSTAALMCLIPFAWTQPSGAQIQGSGAWSSCSIAKSFIALQLRGVARKSNLRGALRTAKGARYTDLVLGRVVMRTIVIASRVCESSRAHLCNPSQRNAGIRDRNTTEALGCERRSTLNKCRTEWYPDVAGSL